MSAAAVEIEIDAVQAPEGFDAARLHTVLGQLLEDHDESRTITCILTDDSRLRSLNLEFRSIDSPTDVLSFELGDDLHPEVGCLGEVYISVERAAEQALNGGVGREVAHLAVHGALHLLGYEHDTDAGQHRMRLQEKQYVGMFARAPQA